MSGYWNRYGIIFWSEREREILFLDVHGFRDLVGKFSSVDFISFRFHQRKTSTANMAEFGCDHGNRDDDEIHDDHHRGHVFHGHHQSKRCSLVGWDQVRDEKNICGESNEDSTIEGNERPHFFYLGAEFFVC